METRLWNIFKTANAITLTNNLAQNICRLFHFLAQFLFTASETKLDYYRQRENVEVASRVAEYLKT